jgi:uncharacterized phage protein gp47/JayE
VIYLCCDERRRNAVRAFAGLNGIDFLEVVDNDAASSAERQRSLRIHFLKSPAPPNIQPANVRIDGGERIRNITVDAVAYDADVLVAHVDRAGDFSTYQLRLVTVDAQGNPLDQPFAGLDVLLAAVDFSFKVECPTDFDCETLPACPVPEQPVPDISYLAKDYASFRQLMLDRVAVSMPQWQERHAADVGIALIEALAYVGDYLSYRQDAIATEAYLGTARSRVSVRRHARLVDYRMHDGVCARVWLHIPVTADAVLPKGTQAFTQIDGLPVQFTPGSAGHTSALAATSEVFETLHEGRLFAGHNEIRLYTWGNARCCLPAGSTRATLLGSFPNLKVNDVIVFEEKLGPTTGNAADANATHRHAVRLSAVTISSDRLGGQFATPPNTNPIAVTEIEWVAEDALPFPLCISNEVRQNNTETPVDGISVARANIVLADHGRTITGEELKAVPQPTLLRIPARGGDRCVTQEPDPVPPRFRPRLKRTSLTRAVPYDPLGKLPAASAIHLSSPQDAVPVIALRIKDQISGVVWTAVSDLLDSTESDPHFIAETESDGTVFLRFGDDRHGLRPLSGTVFVAAYRVGNGTQGNVASDAIAHIATSLGGIQGVRNPLPAIGGVEPESIEHVRQNAPFAFRSQARAVTADDYVAVAEQHPGVQKAAATLRWTGSWRTAFLTVDRLGALPVDADFETAMRTHVEEFRLAGHDVEVDGPRFVPLEIELRICVNSNYFRGDVKEALLDVFSNRVLADGRRGLFHPDNLTFAQPIYLSALYAAAQGVEGVSSVEVTTFQRQDRPNRDAFDKGRLELGRLEIARLDNDPNFPDRGVLRLTLEGGK